jgi:hypothetical protein
MTALANLTIKKDDGTTDITWTGDVASSGDKSPARYSSKTVTTIPAFQPKMSVQSENGGVNGSVRRVKINMIYPYFVTDSTTNLSSEVARCVFRGEWSVPQNVPSTVVNEFASQLTNLLDHTDMVSVVKTQQAPT